MMLWLLLVSISSSVPPLMGLIEGGKMGWMGGIAGLILGLALGLAWFFVLLRIRMAIIPLISRSDAGWRSSLVVGVFYALMLISGAVSGCLTREAVKLMVPG